MTIFIGGMHGVGKTHLAKPAAERMKLVYASASQLIRSERGLASWGSDKVVSDVNANQRALVSAARRIHQGGIPLVLDGHFVLRAAPGRHQLIPLDVFAELKCTAVILLQAPASVVLARLSGRGDESWTEDEVIAFSVAELDHGSAVAASLRVPLLLPELPSPKEFDACLRQVVG